MQRRFSFAGAGRRWGAAVLTVAAAGVAINVGSSSAATAPTAKTAAAACGSIPKGALADPNHLLKSLPASYRADYTGYPATMLASAYANWKPKGKGPYVVGILWGPLANPFETASYTAMQTFLKKSPLVKKVIAEAAATNDVAPQLQQYQSLVQQGVNIIIAQPNSEVGFEPAMIAAGKQGIPTLLGTLRSTTPYTVDIAPNAYGAVAKGTATVLKALAGNAQGLFVHGIRAVSTDQDTAAAFKDTIALCANASVAGEVDGLFAPPVAKSAVQQFLGTHPAPITIAGEAANMTPAIIQAFQQAGRPVPAIVDNAAGNGSIAWLAQNPTNKGVALAYGPTSLADLAVRVALRMLAGQGLKISTVVWPGDQLNSAQAKKLVPASWTIDTPGVFENPRSSWLPNSVLSSLFKHPKKKLS